MARSLLPSTWRRAGHAKQLVKRAGRRAVSQLMARMEDDPSAWDDLDGLFDSGQRTLGPIVRRRRSADKVAPFIRWAVKTTAALPKASRLHHLQGVLPKGLIGRHALSHLERLEPFDRRPRTVWRRTTRLLDRGHVANVLRHVLEVRGGHRFVNEVLARHALIDQTTSLPLVRKQVRSLLGAHDVLAFLSDLERGPHHQKFLVDVLCRALWSARFELERAQGLLESPVRVPPAYALHGWAKERVLS